MPSKALIFLSLCIFVRLLTPGVASPLTAVHPPVLYLSHDSEDEILRCRVESKVEPTSVHWLFWAAVDAAPIRIQLHNPLYRANGTELTIRRESNVSRVLGLYQCVVAIENHEVASLPSIVKELEHKDLKVSLGSPALLNCSTSYTSVNWTFNGQNFTFKNHQSMSFSVDGLEKLVIREVGENDTGIYTCETTGERRILKTFNLTIEEGKKFQRFSQLTTVALSPLHPSTFLDCVCYVSDARVNKSKGQGQADWRRNGTILEPQPLLDSTCLSVIKVRKPGLYTCSIAHQKNQEKTRTRHVVTYNITRQDTDAEFSLIDVTDNEVSCLIDVRQCPDVTWLFHNGKKKHVFNHTSCMNSKGRMSATFHGDGIYQCMMETALGWKETSRVITAPTATEAPTTETPSSSGKELSSQRTDSVTTTSIATAYLTAASPYEPTNSVPTESFTVKSVSPTSISVELRDPAAWQTNEIDVFYRDTSSVGDGNVKRETMEVASKSHTIQRLKPNTTYEVWIEPVFPNGKVPEGGNKHKKKMKTLMAPPTLSDETTESKDNMFLGIVLGSVLGVLALLLVAVLVVVAINRRRRRKEEETSASRQQYEKARKAEGNAYAFPEAPTPCLESPKRTVSPSPPPKKVAFDDYSDIEDDPPPPGYAPVISQAAVAAVTESQPAQQPSALQSTPSVSKQDIDDGIPNYAQLNEASKIKYRRKSSARRLREIEGLDDGIEVLDYAELEMPHGGPIPTRSPDDEVDYAEIDFTRTTHGEE